MNINKQPRLNTNQNQIKAPLFGSKSDNLESIPAAGKRLFNKPQKPEEKFSGGSGLFQQRSNALDSKSGNKIFGTGPKKNERLLTPLSSEKQFSLFGKEKGDAKLISDSREPQGEKRTHNFLSGNKKKKTK